MFFDKFKTKYPIENWVTSSRMVDVGDRVVFKKDGMEVRATYMGTPVDTSVGTIRVKTDDSMLHIVNYHNTIVFRIPYKISALRKCSCGAKHTSNPTYHLTYCDFI